MQQVLRSPVMTSMAVAGAGLIAIVPSAAQLPGIQIDKAGPITTAVELTSGIADTWVDAFGESAAFLGHFAANAPENLLAAGQGLIHAPGQLPSLTVDFLGGLIGTPDVFNAPPSLISGVSGPFFVAFGQTLPAPFGASASGSGLFIDAMANVNAVLQSLWATGEGLNGIGSFVPNLAAGIEAAPGQLLSVAAAAAAHPEDIPGLFTYLLGSAFAPSPDLIQTPSLLSQLVGPPTVALQHVLPTPIGGETGLFMQGMVGINELLTKAFELLPNPEVPAIISLSDLVSLPDGLSSGLGDLATNIGDLLGNIPVIGDAFQWIIDALMGLL